MFIHDRLCQQSARCRSAANASELHYMVVTYVVLLHQHGFCGCCILCDANTITKDVCRSIDGNTEHAAEFLPQSHDHTLCCLYGDKFATKT